MLLQNRMDIQMKMPKNVKNNSGFTLVELMVVLVIIGLLATFAIPRFSSAVYKTKATEFPTILKAIYNAEKSIQDETGSFGPLEELDIDIESLNESKLFDYTVTSSNWDTEFLAIATVKKPGFGKATAGKQATIDQDNVKSGDQELIKYIRSWR